MPAFLTHDAAVYEAVNHIMQGVDPAVPGMENAVVDLPVLSERHDCGDDAKRQSSCVTRRATICPHCWFNTRAAHANSRSELIHRQIHMILVRYRLQRLLKCHC